MDEIMFYRLDGMASVTSHEAVFQLFNITLPDLSEKEFGEALKTSKTRGWSDWENTWQEWRKRGIVNVRE